MKIRTVKYYFKESILSIIRNRLMSIASITTVALTLFIFGIFMMLYFNVNKAVSTVQDKVEIKAFLSDEYSTTIKQQGIKQQIEKITGVKEIVYESKEDALKNFKKQLGDNKDMAEGLEGQNPLPAAYIIKVSDPAKVAGISKQVSSIQGIKKVNDGKTMIEKLVKITKFINVVSIVLMVILAAVSIFLISNTIKLTVYARKREITIMKYIGATDWFIRWPFVIEGVLLGFLGAIVSTLVLYFGYKYAANAVATNIMIFTLVPVKEIMSGMNWQFGLIGMLIGGFGSLISLRKFLVI